MAGKNAREDTSGRPLQTSNGGQRRQSRRKSTPPKMVPCMFLSCQCMRRNEACSSTSPLHGHPRAFHQFLLVGGACK